MILHQVDVPCLPVNSAPGEAQRDVLQAICSISVEALASARKLSPARSWEE